jgi:hypothetical protein
VLNCLPQRFQLCNALLISGIANQELLLLLGFKKLDERVI